MQLQSVKCLTNIKGKESVTLFICEELVRSALSIVFSKNWYALSIDRDIYSVEQNCTPNAERGLLLWKSH
jgi:hypothetical protein